MVFQLDRSLAYVWLMRQTRLELRLRVLESAVRSSFPNSKKKVSCVWASKLRSFFPKNWMLYLKCIFVDVIADNGSSLKSLWHYSVALLGSTLPRFSSLHTPLDHRGIADIAKNEIYESHDWFPQLLLYRRQDVIVPSFPFIVERMFQSSLTSSSHLSVASRSRAGRWIPISSLATVTRFKWCRSSVCVLQVIEVELVEYWNFVSGWNLRQHFCCCESCCYIEFSEVQFSN